MSALPDRVWLTEVVYDAAGVQIKGNAPTNNLLSDYLARLEGSSSLADMILRGSALRTVRGREWVEYFLQAAVRDPGSTPEPAGSPPSARLEELEKAFASRQDTAQMLRELQMLALDAVR
jgi:Tfp pilus assembly protein PilN